MNCIRHPSHRRPPGLNFVAKLLHRHIHWDTETLGCSPSLSSIPTSEQRLLEEALQEVRPRARPWCHFV